MQKTNIAWTTFTSNPLKYRHKSDGKVVWACVKKSSGCSKCYSESIALRYDRGKIFNAANMEELEPFLDEQELHELLTRKKCGGLAVASSRVFLGDMTDVFGEWVSFDILDGIFGVFARRQDVIFQVLTKRPERMVEYFKTYRELPGLNVRLKDMPDGGAIVNPLNNVWLGTSIESQQAADSRIPHLLATPAAVRFLSAEPLLGPIDFSRIPDPDYPGGQDFIGYETSLTQGIGWVICGCESLGPRAGRFADSYEDAARSLLRQCQAAGVPFFHKQMPINGRVSHDPREWPEDLRVQQFPGGEP